MTALSLSSSKKNKKTWQLSSRDKFKLGVTVCALLVGTSLPGRLIVSTSSSLNHRVFFLVPATNKKKITTGDFVVFRHKIAEPKLIKKTLNPNKDRFIKKIGCSPGEQLKRKDDTFYCQGIPLGKALAQDSRGDRLPQFQFNGTVPENSYFMIGDNPRSYDSRYFGFVKDDTFLYKALPLW